MPIAEIGRWEFLVPDGWGFKDSGVGVSYLESPDGTKGMYVKEVAMSEAMATNQALAEHIQDVHRRSFEKDPTADWTAMDSRGHVEGHIYRSVLDLYQASTAYRLLSLVACDDRYGLQITIHDYNCEDYGRTVHQFADIENSIRQFAGAA